eukprot:382270_1
MTDLFKSRGTHISSRSLEKRQSKLKLKTEFVICRCSAIIIKDVDGNNLCNDCLNYMEEIQLIEDAKEKFRKYEEPSDEFWDRFDNALDVHEICIIDQTNIDPPADNDNDDNDNDDTHE